ncbi:MAG: choice-of-anchor B family protein [Flavobacteriales bacterium TMED84]|nr:MAG: choice-of-anchor B family protein [Flavobacteriales bacterium TMED84]
MKNIITILILLFSFFCNSQEANLIYNWNDTSLVGSWAYDNTFNEIWGFEISNHEFAVIGSTAGTHIFDVSNVQNIYETAFIAGAYTGGGVIHRDYHDFDGYLYAVCDEGSSSTLQIIDISNLPYSFNVVYDDNALFNKAHNIFIDTSTAKLYACASNNAMDVYSLANPVLPVLINELNDPTIGHVHDAYVRNDTAYLNCGNDGFRVFDYSNVNSISNQPNLLVSLTSYPDAGYNHSGWLNNSGDIYAMQDENHGYDIKILDLSDFTNISVISVFNSGVDANSMAHNAIIKDNLLYVAYYHDGLRVYDISNPNTPIEVCYYDTYGPNNHISYRGAWGVYPYLSSGNILVSDMQTGLYIFKCDATSNLETKKINEIIFPNPVKNYFSLPDESDGILTIYDLNGKILFQADIIKEQIFNISLNDGLYIYKINNQKLTTKTGKFIVKND